MLLKPFKFINKYFSPNVRLKLFLSAKKKFNFDAKKGLQFMFDRGLMSEDPESVANFLYESDGLKKVCFVYFFNY